MADMYFKVPVDSETGRKFKAIVERKAQVWKEELAMAEKHGYERWRGSRFALWGGVGAADFP